MAFYWNEEDRKDQQERRSINEGKIYTDTANCDCCGNKLHGSWFDCIKCNALVCTLCICGDGCCPSCTGSLIV